MELKVEGGKIEYHLPDYSESMDILGGLDLSDLGDNEIKSQYKMLAKFSKRLEPLIDKIDIKGVKSFKELMNSPDYSDGLSTITTNVAERVTAYTKVKAKKKTSKK